MFLRKFNCFWKKKEVNFSNERIELRSMTAQNKCAKTKLKTDEGESNVINPTFIETIAEGKSKKPNQTSIDSFSFQDRTKFE